MIKVFISGLRKQSGKTVVSAGLSCTLQSLSYPTSYFKTIQTGANNELYSQDALKISEWDSNIKTSAGYVLKSPCSPIAGAYETKFEKLSLKKIESDYLMNITGTDCHIIEGSNSISVPVDDKNTEADVIRLINAPVILVVNPGQTPVDGVITGLNYANTKKLPVIGVVLNEYDNNSKNIELKYLPQLIKEYTGVKVLGYFPHYEDFPNLGADVLIADTLKNMNIEEIFGLKIAKLN